MKVGGLRVAAGLDVAKASLTHSPYDASVVIDDGAVTVRLTADATEDVLRISVASRSGPTNVTAQIVPLRTAAEAGTPIDKYFGRGPCNTTGGVKADTVANASATVFGGQGVALWHRNPSFDEYSVMYDTLRQQGVPLDNATARTVDMLGDRVTAMALVGSSSATVNDTTIRAEGSGVVYLDVVTVSQQIAAAASPGAQDPVVDALAAAIKSSACSLAGGQACAARFNATAAVWAGLWNRSYVSVSAASGASAETLEASANLTARYVWQRFISLAGGRRSLTPLKFNGMLWTVPTSQGTEDYRGWGGDFWSQNSRQAVHEALASADDDVVRSFFAMYKRAMPVAEARERAYWPGSTSGFFFPETMMMFGTYDQGEIGWGCGWNPPAGSPWPIPHNTYTRYYYSGTLEYALLSLDAADWAADDSFAKEWAVPFADGITAHYFNLYRATAPGGTLDMFPAQAMETWQCGEVPATRDGCTTDPVTAVSGLRAVLTRLLALPASLTTPAMRAAWTSRLAAVPPLPNATAKDGSTIWAPGKQHDPHPRNSENVASQPVFPYRLATAAKAAALGPASEAAALVPVATSTFGVRPFPCNDGWCWDLITAAALNLTSVASEQLLARATTAGAFQGGWPGFAGHYQDYEPSLDEFAWLRTALHAMLLQPVDDVAGRMVVLPSWDAASLDVSFKLRGPRATVVELACKGGAIESLRVDPPSRAADVLVAGCGGGMRTAAELLA